MRWFALIALALITATLPPLDKATDLNLTVQEELIVRTKQLHLLQSELVERDAKEDVAAKLADLRGAVDEIYKAHGVTRDDHNLCAGPGVGCENVPDDGIILKAKVKP